MGRLVHEDEPAMQARSKAARGPDISNISGWLVEGWDTGTKPNPHQNNHENDNVCRSKPVLLSISSWQWFVYRPNAQPTAARLRTRQCKWENGKGLQWKGSFVFC
jgi:hypothetical protein